MLNQTILNKLIESEPRTKDRSAVSQRYKQNSLNRDLVLELQELFYELEE